MSDRHKEINEILKSLPEDKTLRRPRTLRDAMPYENPPYEVRIKLCNGTLATLSGPEAERAGIWLATTFPDNWKIEESPLPAATPPKTLPRWKCNELGVEAFKIQEIHFHPLYPDNPIHKVPRELRGEFRNWSVFPSEEYFRQYGRELVGGYYVRYEDGTESYWRGADFEHCFELTDPAQEPK